MSATDTGDWSYSHEMGAVHTVMPCGCAAAIAGLQLSFEGPTYGTRELVAADACTMRLLWRRVEPPAFMAGLEIPFTQCG